MRPNHERLVLILLIGAFTFLLGFAVGNATDDGDGRSIGQVTAIAETVDQPAQLQPASTNEHIALTPAAVAAAPEPEPATTTTGLQAAVEVEIAEPVVVEIDTPVGSPDETGAPDEPPVVVEPGWEVPELPDCNDDASGDCWFTGLPEGCEPIDTSVAHCYPEWEPTSG